MRDWIGRRLRSLAGRSGSRGGEVDPGARTPPPRPLREHLPPVLRGDSCATHLADLLERHLAERRPPRVALLEHDGASPWAGAVTGRFPKARIVHIAANGSSLFDQHAVLAAGGRFDAVVVDGTVDTARVANAFLHLRGGGKLFMQVPDDPGAVGGLADADPFGPVVQAATSPNPVGDAGAADDRVLADERATDQQALVDAVASAEFGSGHVVLTNRRPLLAKLREAQLDRVVELRGAQAGTVLRTLPGQTFKARCLLRQNQPERDPDMPETYHVPDMSLREYPEVLCMPRQVAIARNLVLPDTFRFNAAPRLKNAFLEDVGPDFAVPKRPVRAGRRLDGAYFYLDSEWTHHFGHAMTEQMSRLWGVAEARERYPGLKAIISRRRAGTGLAEYERAIFGAVGFAPQDIVLHHRPARVEKLVAASPMYVLPTHAHPDLREVWREIGAAIALDAPRDLEYPRRLFCSRRRARRHCSNLGEVEALFSGHGFTVVYPEDYPFPQQVRMFREAEVVAGFAGSGMFTAAFCPGPRRIIVLGPTSYPQRNEYMICAVAGHELDYVWSAPELENPPGGQERYAGFTFDFGDEGVFLKEILSSI